MQALLNEILAQPGFSPGLLLVGCVMYGAWTAAYFFIIVSCFKQKSYGVPWVCLVFNVVWEACFSFNLLDQRLFWFFLWGNRLWLAFDLVIATQFLMYGPRVQVQPLLRRYFYPVAALTLALCVGGLVTFTPFFNEFTGSASSMMMNFVMSLLYIFMLLERPDLKGISYPAAWLKMIGTAGGSVFLYFWLPAQFENGHLRTHPDVPTPRTWAFMWYLYISIFVIDCIYIALVAKRRKELRDSGGKNPSGSSFLSPKVVPAVAVPAVAAVLFLGVGTTFDVKAATVSSASDSNDPNDRIERLRRLDLESILASVASKKEEPIFTTPAPVTAISDEEIARSGVRNVPDALRLAPGMEVALINGNQWAVSSRGFNDRFANKLLVLQDGRIVYNPQFNGVYWDSINPMLADIRQIEVVRGPGGSLWGANAVNGVVNIVSKDAHDTLGGYATTGGGPGQAFGEARYGEKIGETGAIREYVKYDWHDPLKAGDSNNHDGGQTLSTGFRGDWQLEENHLTLQGDYTYGWRQQPIYYASYAPPYPRLAAEDFTRQLANVLGRATHTFADGSDMKLQAYFDHSDSNPDSFGLRYNVGDVDFQHRVFLPLNQDLTYGLGYRVYSDDVANKRIELTEDPAGRTLQWFSAFFRDEIGLVEDRLKAVVGAKFEHNDFTGFEGQPDARLLFLPSTNQTLWVGVTRAVRTPSRAHEDLTALQPLDYGLGRYTGNRTIESERLISLQSGWRMRLSPHAGIDLSGYYSFYRHMDSTAVGTPFLETNPAPAHLIIPVQTVNGGSVDTFGLEASADYQPMDWWQLRAGYSYFNFNRQVNIQFDNHATPHHQGFIRSSMDLPAHLVFDGWLRVRSRLQLYTLDAFADMDLRLAWRPHAWLELSVVGQNLFYSQRQDFGIPSYNISAPISSVARTFYGQVTFRF